jgi:hypothetical protein
MGGLVVIEKSPRSSENHDIHSAFFYFLSGEISLSLSLSLGRNPQKDEITASGAVAEVERSSLARKC